MAAHSRYIARRWIPGCRGTRRAGPQSPAPPGTPLFAGEDGTDLGSEPPRPLCWQLCEYYFSKTPVRTHTAVIALCSACSGAQSCPTLCDPQTAARQAPLSMGLPRQDTGVACHFLVQGIFPIQGWNPHLFCLLRPRPCPVSAHLSP